MIGWCLNEIPVMVWPELDRAHPAALAGSEGAGQKPSTQQPHLQTRRDIQEDAQFSRPADPPLDCEAGEEPTRVVVARVEVDVVPHRSS